jgi:AcrR family transcriptional regulator
MMNAGTGRERRQRVRDPELHRQKILEAAAAAFMEFGFHDTTIRYIAQRAGVTHGLVLRHFGTKEKLFITAVPGPRDLILVAQGPRESLPERIASAYVHRMEGDTSVDPFMALLRSAMTDNSNTSDRLLVAMQESTAVVYRDLLGDEAVATAVPFLAALLVGVTFNRYILRSGALAEMPVSEFTEHLETTVRAILVPGTGAR